MIYGGLQSLLFYTSMTWLPTMAVQAGLSKVESGLLASVFTLISLPYSLTVPSLTTRLSDQKRHLMLVILVGAGILGVAMLLVPTSNFFYWLIINALIGSCVSALFPYLMVTFSMKSTTPEKTAQLSGLSQTGGYIFAALGPILFGYSKSLFHSWTPAVVLLLILTLIMAFALYQVEKVDKIL